MPGSPPVAPATWPQPPALPDLNDRAVRVELTRTAVPAMVRLAEQWQLAPQVMCTLMGGISTRTWTAWRRSAPAALSADQLARASYLLGIYEALHALFRPPLADAWVSRPNTNPLFAGEAPIEVMARGGVVALAQVRTLLDGARAGLCRPPDGPAGR